MSVGRRFIAGATCPSCKQVDKLFMYEKDGQKIQECVRCGFQEVMSAEGEVQPTDKTAEAQAGVQVIDLKDLSSDSSKKH